MIDANRPRFLLLALLILVAPHGLHLHWSHIGLFVAFWLWRWLGIARPGLLPRGAWLPLLTLAAAVVVIVSRRGAIDLTTSTGLFVAGLGLKLMELKSARDLYFVVFLGWFVALTQFLYDQSLTMAVYAAMAAVALTAVLAQCNAVQPLPYRALARVVAGLLIPALPVMVGLFLLFPRPHGGFFHLPFDSRAVTGLSEVMEPGAVARLATSYEVAFRVDFGGDMPPPERRYWRAQVFWRFDGRRWLPHPVMQQPLSRSPVGRGKVYRYHVTVEPHHRRWLFSLGMPATVPAIARLTREQVLVARWPLDERVRYAAASHEAYRFPPLSPFERRLALQLPVRPSPRIQALVAELRRRAEDEVGFAAAVLTYFRDNDFRYTLHPGSMDDPIETFLFETRAGFCEHYASALAYLLRAAGIPARIVGGYLGGFVNPRGGFLEVYQANAHVWVELWSDGKGWIRVDPTEAVAPRYVEQVRNLPEPLSAVTPAPDPTPRQSSGRAAETLSGWQAWVRNGLILWSDLDHRWHLWVLSYDRKAQRRVWSALGRYWPAAFLLTALGLTLWRLRQRRSLPEDPLLREYHRFLERLQRAGLHKQPAETPRAFAERACRRFPEEAEQIRRVTEVFMAGRYGRGGTIETVRTLRRLLGRKGERLSLKAVERSRVRGI